MNSAFAVYNCVTVEKSCGDELQAWMRQFYHPYIIMLTDMTSFALLELLKKKQDATMLFILAFLLLSMLLNCLETKFLRHSAQDFISF